MDNGEGFMPGTMTISQVQALKDNLYIISLLEVIIELKDLQLDTEPEHVVFLSLSII